MTGEAKGSPLLCLPVRRVLDRFVRDDARPDGLDELPEFSDLRDYLAASYREITALVEWRGFTFEAQVYVPDASDDTAYALIEQSRYTSPVSHEADTSSHLQNRVAEWVTDHLSYGEVGPLASPTRLRTEFVEPDFEVWDRTHGATGNSLRWRDTLNRGRVVLLGGPGSGKSTILRFIALNEAERFRSGAPARIPLYISLRDVVEPCDVVDLAQAAMREQALSESTHDFERALRSGKLLLLLDGLDEVRDDLRDKVTAEVLRMARMHPKVGMYIGTRQWAYHWRFPGFLHVEVKPFSQERIQEWLERRLRRTDSRMTIHLMDAFRSDPELQELGSNPLLLGLLASVFENTGTIPRKRADLLSRYFDVVLEQWDTFRGVRRSTEYVLKEDKIEALALIAVATWRESKLSFTEAEFCSRQEEWSAAKSEDVARLILRDSGLFTGSVPDTQHWRFAHEIFRDHLAALYLVARPDDVLEDFAKEQLSREYLKVWRHACGIATDASPLLRVMRENKGLPAYERARWLTYALGDGANVNAAEMKKVEQTIIGELENANSRVSGIDLLDQQWTVHLRATGVAAEKASASAIGDIVKVITGGGWSPMRVRITAEVSETSPRLVRTVLSLLNRSWLVSKIVDASRQTVQIIGVRR